MAKSKYTTVSGIVAEDQWDDEDELESVLIQGDDGHDYMVKNEGAGRRLFDFIGSEVEVKGTVLSEGSQRYLRVNSFKMLDGFDDGDSGDSSDDGDDGDEEEFAGFDDFDDFDNHP